MSRARSPNRDKAFEIYKNHNGNIANREIARTLYISEKTISRWKAKDNWNDKLNKVLQTDLRSTTKEKRKKWGQPNNKNSVGCGAPK
ncbi:phage terminase small subunit-related protein [Clostridium perfringens]|uniref:phage terminase small subunit-related protein n=1 Tax=Clostridium perfringens TaxID=1502 RepID=UPI00311A92C7